MKAHFNNGFASYPDKRILYPDYPGEAEEAWLNGYNRAKFEAEQEIANTGIDTYLWSYKNAQIEAAY